MTARATRTRRPRARCPSATASRATSAPSRACCPGSPRTNVQSAWCDERERLVVVEALAERESCPRERRAVAEERCGLRARGRTAPSRRAFPRAATARGHERAAVVQRVPPECAWRHRRRTPWRDRRTRRLRPTRRAGTRTRPRSTTRSPDERRRDVQRRGERIKPSTARNTAVSPCPPVARNSRLRLHGRQTERALERDDLSAVPQVVLHRAVQLHRARRAFLERAVELRGGNFAAACSSARFERLRRASAVAHGRPSVAGCGGQSRGLPKIFGQRPRDDAQRRPAFTRSGAASGPRCSSSPGSAARRRPFRGQAFERFERRRTAPGGSVHAGWRIWSAMRRVSVWAPPGWPWGRKIVDERNRAPRGEVSLESRAPRRNGAPPGETPPRIGVVMRRFYPVPVRAAALRAHRARGTRHRLSRRFDRAARPRRHPRQRWSAHLHERDRRSLLPRVSPNGSSVTEWGSTTHARPLRHRGLFGLHHMAYPASPRRESRSRIATRSSGRRRRRPSRSGGAPAGPSGDWSAHVRLLVPARFQLLGRCRRP